jgi:hypothetical protein
MQWKVHTERSVHAGQRLDLRIADVELPDGRHLDRRFAAVVMGLLLSQRH